MEEWKIIEDFPLYEISNLGRIKSKIKKEKILDGYIDYRNKIVWVEIRNKNEKKRLKISELVARYFVPNPHNYKYYTFKDRDKLNVQASNIEWIEKEKYIREPKKVYALYKDDELVGIGNLKELEKITGMKKSSILAANSPSHHNRPNQRYRWYLVEAKDD